MYKMTNKKQIRLDTNNIETLLVFQKYAKKNKYKNIYLTSNEDYIYFTVGKLTSRANHYYLNDKVLINVSIPVDINISGLKNSLPSLTLLDGTVTLATYGYETSWNNVYVDQVIEPKPLFVDIDGVTIKDLELLYGFTDTKTSYPEMTNHILIGKNYMGSSDGGKMICIKHASSTIKEDHEGILIPAHEAKNILDVFKAIKSKVALYSFRDGKITFSIMDTWYTYDQVEGIKYPNYSELVEPPEDTKFNPERLDTKGLEKIINSIKTSDKDNAITINYGFISNTLGVKQTFQLEGSEDIATHYINKDFLKLMVKLSKSRDEDTIYLQYHNTHSFGLTERLQFKGIKTPIYQTSGANYRAVYMPLNPDLFV